MRKVIGIGETILDILFLGDDPVAAVPGGLRAGDALFGLMFYHRADRSLCLHPYSAVTRSKIIRLQY